MVSFEEGIIYAVIIGGLIGIAYGLRKLVVLERGMLRLESNIQKVVNRIEKEEFNVEKVIKRKR